MERKNELNAHIESLAKLKLYQKAENVLVHRTPEKLPGADKLKEDQEAAI